MAPKSRRKHSYRRHKSRLFRNNKQISCCYCNTNLSFSKATVEHIIPLSQGGANHIANMTISCAPCNNYRPSSYSFDEWKSTISKYGPPNDRLCINNDPYLKLYKMLQLSGRLIERKYLK